MENYITYTKKHCNDVPFLKLAYHNGALVQDVKISNNLSTKTIKHETSETWDAYEHVRLKTPEASKGCGAQEDEGHEARSAGQHARHVK